MLLAYRQHLQSMLSIITLMIEQYKEKCPWTLLCGTPQTTFVQAEAITFIFNLCLHPLKTFLSGDKSSMTVSEFILLLILMIQTR